MVTFRVHYWTKWGESISLIGIQNWKHYTTMEWAGDGWWVLKCENIQTPSVIRYKYVVIENGEEKRRDMSSSTHELILSTDASVEVVDEWGLENSYESNFNNNSYFGSSRQEMISVCNLLGSENDCLRVKFEIQVPFVESGQYIAVCGSDAVLGNWKVHNCLTLHPDEDVGTVWKGQCTIPKNHLPFEYKYVMRDQSGILMWEGGANRVANASTDSQILVLSCRSFRYTYEFWSKTKLRIPVDILRSMDSFTLGEIPDLKKIISFAHFVGLKQIEVSNLSVEEFIVGAHGSLNSNFVSLLGCNPSEILKKEITSSMELLHHEKICKGFGSAIRNIYSYEHIYRLKSRLLKKIFMEKKDELLSDKEFLNFCSKNESWLTPYSENLIRREKLACNFVHSKSSFFCQQGDTTCEEALSDMKNLIGNGTCGASDERLYSFFCQFIAHQQLEDVEEYARMMGVKFSVASVDNYSSHSFCHFLSEPEIEDVGVEVDHTYAAWEEYESRTPHMEGHENNCIREIVSIDQSSIEFFDDDQNQQQHNELYQNDTDRQEASSTTVIKDKQPSKCLPMFTFNNSNSAQERSVNAGSKKCVIA